MRCGFALDGMFAMFNERLADAKKIGAVIVLIGSSEVNAQKSKKGGRWPPFDEDGSAAYQVARKPAEPLWLVASELMMPL